MPRLLDEIMEQPDVLQRLIDAELPAIRELARNLRQREVQSVLIAARGTSDNAATYGKYVFGTLNRLPVILAAPSLYTIYDQPPLLRNTLVLGISQSGMSPDIVSVVENARAQGMPTVAISNAPDSPLAQVAESLILIHAGEEHSIAATKTYTTELMALALLAVALRDDTELLQGIVAVPQAMRAALESREQIALRAERYRYMENCAIIGRGYNYATAYEIALKLKELTYVGANPYSSAEFLHGPIATVESGFPVLVVAPSGRILSDMVQIIGELRERQAELLIISDRDEVLEMAHTALSLPLSVDEWLSPLVSILPGQLFAYYLALAKGIDPEHPRGLRKVTETY
jgi:glucosamine--fructose-6-phosphate aminotransferase (isomerizing)